MRSLAWCLLPPETKTGKRATYADPGADAMDRLIQAMAVLAPTGVPRIVGTLFRPAMVTEYAAELRKYLPAPTVESELAFLAQSKHMRSMAHELRASTEAELRTARNFGDIPLIVLSERWVFPKKPGHEIWKQLASRMNCRKTWQGSHAAASTFASSRAI